MAAGLDLPKKIFAHGHLLFQDEKMSKSRGNIQSAQPIVSVLGVDALRYFLLREIVFGADGGFSREALIARYNSDLANGLGNLASRTAAMIERSFAGEIPKAAELQPQDQELAKVAKTAVGEVLDHYDRFEFSRALELIWSIIAAADKYLTTEQPWSLGPSDADQQRRGTILWVTAEVLRIVTALAHPVLPQSTAKVWKLLGQTGNLASLELDNLRWGQLAPGVKLGEFQALFPRVERTEAMERIEAMENQSQKPVAAPASAAPANAPTSAAAPAAALAATEKIGIEDFAKVEMRVGQIQTAERIAGADKLLKLTVDIGTEVRQICAGIAQFYEPEKLIGRKVAVVTNLAPRKLRGIESNGMIVAASVGPEGRPVLASFLEDVEVGARLK
jgi:methionyl-tRNA synthetase